MNSFYHPLGENYGQTNPGTYVGHQSGAALDFCTTAGTPVYSMTDGIVTWAGQYGEAGPTVIVKNTSNGFTSLYDNNRPIWIKYLHLLDVAVEEGQQVTPGTLLGHLGWLKGSANGVSHLHLDISEIPNDDIRDYTKIIDVTGNSGDPKNLKYLMSNYDELIKDNKGFIASSGIGNRCSYIFTIFNQDVSVIAPSLNIDDNFYERCYSNNNGYSFDELLDMVAGLCVRECGASADGAKYTLSGLCLYAKLIRNRILDGGFGDGIYGVITAPSQFSGATTVNTRYEYNSYKVTENGLDYETTKQYILSSFCGSDDSGILPEHLIGYDGQNIGNTILYNYGYWVDYYYANTKNNETEIKTKIENGTLPSHKNFAKLSRVVGNTAFFEKY